MDTQFLLDVSLPSVSLFIQGLV